jgi:uncharacterized protein with HEPN domain
MNHPEPDNIRLRHMLDAARAALAFAAGRSRADLAADLMLQFALVRALEIVGEAAARLSEPTRAAHPEIPWGAIIGMRNRLVHGYFDVDLEIVWRTTIESLPSLVAALESIPVPPPDKPLSGVGTAGGPDCSQAGPPAAASPDQ